MPLAGTLELPVVPNVAAVGPALEAELAGAGTAGGSKVASDLEKTIVPSGGKAGQGFIAGLGKVLQNAIGKIPGASGIAKNLEQLAPSATVWVVAAAAVVAFGVVAYKAYQGEQEAVDKLNRQISSSPALIGASTKAFQDQALALEQLTGYQHEQIITADSVLARYNLTQQQIQQLIPLVADYARLTGQDLSTAASNIGKAMLGNTKALKAVGIQFKATGDTAKDFTTIYGALSEKVKGTAADFLQTHPFTVLGTELHTLADTAGKDLAPAVSAVAKTAVDFGKIAIPIIGDALQGLVTILKPVIFALGRVDQILVDISDIQAAGLSTAASTARTAAQEYTALAVSLGATSLKVEAMGLDFAVLKKGDPAAYAQILAASEQDLSHQFEIGKLSQGDFVQALVNMGVPLKTAQHYVWDFKASLTAAANAAKDAETEFEAAARGTGTLSSTQQKAYDAVIKARESNISLAGAVDDVAQASRDAAQAERDLNTAQNELAKATDKMNSTHERAANLLDQLATAERATGKAFMDDLGPGLTQAVKNSNAFAQSETQAKRASDSLVPSLEDLASKADDLSKNTKAAADAELQLYDAELQAAGGITAVAGAVQSAAADKKALAQAELAVKDAAKQAYDQEIANGGSAASAQAAATAAQIQAEQDLAKARLQAVNSQEGVTSAVLAYEQQLIDSGVPQKRAIAEFETYAAKAGLTRAETEKIVQTLQHQIQTQNELAKSNDKGAAQGVELGLLQQRAQAATRASIAATQAHRAAVQKLNSAQEAATKAQEAVTTATLKFEQQLIDTNTPMAGAVALYKEYATKAGISEKAQKAVTGQMHTAADAADKLGVKIDRLAQSYRDLNDATGGAAFGGGTPGKTPLINPPTHGGTPHFAGGGVVKARPGGVLALIAEGGRDEEINPVVPGASRDSGPVTITGVLDSPWGPVQVDGQIQDGINRRSRQLATAGRMGA